MLPPAIIYLPYSCQKQQQHPASPRLTHTLSLVPQVKIWFQNRRTKWKKQDGITNAEANEHKNAATGKNKRGTASTPTTPGADHAKSAVTEGAVNPPTGSDAGSAPTSPSQLSNGATSDLSSSDETSRGEAALGPSPRPDLPQDTLPDHTPGKPDPITTPTAITFNDHIVIKEVVPTTVSLNYKSLTATTPRPPVGALIKPIPTHSPPKALLGTTMNKAHTVSGAATSPPQPLLPRGSPTTVPLGMFTVNSSSSHPASPPTTTTERTLPQETPQRDKVLENGKLRSEGEEISS
nr:homeobox protein HOX3-like [Procambarus clarkii]